MVRCAVQTNALESVFDGNATLDRIKLLITERVRVIVPVQRHAATGTPGTRGSSRESSKLRTTDTTEVNCFDSRREGKLIDIYYQLYSSINSCELSLATSFAACGEAGGSGSWAG